MREPAGFAEAELVVSRSRFVSRAEPAPTREAAEAAVRQVRLAHPHASHVVFAYLVGPPESETAGMSDAGEPRGTAGRPVMDILRGSGVRDVVLTVARYFGGTKLGTGGLVRAYGGAARMVLARLPVRVGVPRCVATAEVPYELLDAVRRCVARSGGSVLHERFATAVAMDVEVPIATEPHLAAELLDVSRGRVQLTRPVAQPGAD